MRQERNLRRLFKLGLKHSPLTIEKDFSTLIQCSILFALSKDMSRGLILGIIFFPIMSSDIQITGISDYLYQGLGNEIDNVVKTF